MLLQRREVTGLSPCGFGFFFLMKMSVKSCDMKSSQKCKWTAKTRAPENNISTLNYFIPLMTIYKENNLLREAK